MPQDTHSHLDHGAVTAGVDHGASIAGDTPRGWERAAAFLSAACAVHCLLLPVVTTLLPALGASDVLHLEGSFDMGLSMLVVLSVAAGAVWGFRRHRDLRVAGAMGIGLLGYLLGHGLESTFLSIAGALILAAASFASTRLSQRCDHAH